MSFYIKIFIPVALLAVVAGVYLIDDKPEIVITPKSKEPTPEERGLVEKKSLDGVEIFKRTFWRTPTAEDVIVKAERSEWINEAESVREWQTHLEVKPGRALRDYLAGNPFRLKKATLEDTEFESTEGLEIQVSPDRSLTLIFDSQKNRLIAKGRGKGFRETVRVGKK